VAEQPGAERQRQCDQHSPGALSHRAAQPLVVQGHVHADREHQRREADVIEQRQRSVARVHHTARAALFARSMARPSALV
jgi:hypothetical protein